MIGVKIGNCNNITEANIELVPGKLNIRYAMNGTGKSTIAKAIKLAVEGEDLSALTTFNEITKPTCEISVPMKTVLVFDEHFVSTIVFQENQVIQNSFDVFIRTPEYEERQESINNRLREMHIDTSSNHEYGKLISTGQAVLGRFTKTNDNKLKKTGILKSLIATESIFTLPEKIKKFQPLMIKDYKVDWVGWKSDGGKYDDNNICPFCTTKLDENYPEEKKIFVESYSKSNVKNIQETLSYFEAVKDYIDPAKLEIMYKCIKDCEDEDTVTLWVTRFHSDLEFLVEKIRKVIEFNSYHVKQSEISTLADKLQALRIDHNALEVFNNDKTIGLINELNKIVLKVAADAEALKKEIGALKGFIGSSVSKSVSDINDFLEMAGINYVLEIQHNSEVDTKATLKYKGKEGGANVDNIKSHLSWGERNAFALVLFMHFAESQNADLFILDDPISSFDTNKKYAIINRLFLNNPKKKSLYKKSVLMLTHDFQPIIDFVVNSKPHGGNTHAAFLRNENGVVVQTDIEETDICSFALLLAASAKNNTLNKVHRITCLRKLIEHTDKSNAEEMAYNILSCLLHGKPVPSFVDGTPMTESNISEAEIFVNKFINDFSYSNYLNNYFSLPKLLSLYKNESNDYFKLQTFRVIMALSALRSKIDDPILKYIDEQFHIENDYVFYLDFTKYNTVPTFVLPKCTEFLKKQNLI